MPERIVRAGARLPGAIVAVILAGGCGRDASRVAVTDGQAQHATASDTLRSAVLFGGDQLGQPQSVAVMGEWLLVSDKPGPHALHLLGRENGRLVRSWGREGAGPGEFRTLWGIQPARDGGAWLYDPSLSRLTLVDVPALAAGRPDVIRRSVNLRAELLPMTALWAADTLLVSSGMFRQGRFAHFDDAGELKRVVGPLPPMRDGVPAQIAQHAYSGSLVMHPSQPLLALGTRHADRLEIYRPDGGLVRVARGPRGFEPAYEMRVIAGEPSMASGEDMRFGYVDLAAAGAHLYGLYSGYSRGERPGRAFYGGEVHVFDWGGNLLRVLPLDHLALALAVSDDERTLYTVRHDPTPAVLQHALPRG